MFGSKDDDCKHVIRFDATNISFSGLEGPDIIKFRLASFQIKRDSLQAAIDIAQVYDLFQYSNCLKAKQFPEGTPEKTMFIDRKSTRLNSSHPSISYAVFCL